MSSTDRSDPNARNRRVAIICACVFFGMVGAAFGSVPLYRAFCQITGFDGATRRADKASDTVLRKTIVVRFDANVRDLPWSFTADQTSQTAKIGETKLAFFKVTNNSDRPITGRAIYNVVPEQAGPYFQKLQCFCFTDQTIPPKTTVDVPVLYFIDPKYAEDINTKGKPEVTLSYTFFPSTTAASQQAPNPAAKKLTPPAKS
ncbi:MAG: cytochrome c oxidase assembly protein [Phenylobacterium sp.]|uniref:cytochrome c oxidase assembly protein n=1 Tax=Phenylobacterium sp. TaxID=1871053 RepID=UPI001A549018|nr:cytochrome c oxidase assembly protein [Phenylobacterium sp.]MBL8770403.1 cytochrome c oxidase assembly protein [Phenylobacterium sp.]